jgi:hypothetical protein
MDFRECNVDDDGDTLSVILLSNPRNGRVEIDGTSLTYVPNRNWFGTERLTYLVSDGRGATADETIRIVVLPVNDAPTVGQIDVRVPTGQIDLDIPTAGDRRHIPTAGDRRRRRRTGCRSRWNRVNTVRRRWSKTA